jgi:hypothetical protein
MSTKKAKNLKALLRRYANLLSQMHKELQRLRYKVEPDPPVQKWNLDAMNLVFPEEPDELAEQLLEAEFHCLEAGEEIRDLLRTQAYKAII